MIKEFDCTIYNIERYNQFNIDSLFARYSWFLARDRSWSLNKEIINGRLLIILFIVISL